MNIITLDYETFYSDDYTLSKMTTESYIRDPRFEALGCAIRFPSSGVAEWWDADELKSVFADIDWANTAVLAHHAQFDGLILSHHYGVKPKFWFDSLSMARLLLGNHLSVGLDALAKHFSLAAKTVPYNLFKGRHWNELTPAVQQMVGDGACHDVDLTWQLFQILGKNFPRQEYEVVDTVIKMFTDPVLRADVDMLAKLWEDEATRKQKRLAELDVTEADLQSAERFAQLLRDCGIEPEMKNGPVSQKTGKSKRNYAFAKTDQFMRDLQEHEDDRVQTLAEARLGVKSTLLQTRAETLGFMAGRGPLTVYIRYAGAGTLRVSGGDGCLTADTLILTLDISGTPKYKKIIDVLLSDLVWDGEEFVEHDGVAFSGYQEVITWDGVSGTHAHQVFCGKESKSLSEALRTKTPIVDCGEPTAWQVEAGRARQRARS